MADDAQTPTRPPWRRPLLGLIVLFISIAYLFYVWPRDVFICDFVNVLPTDVPQKYKHLLEVSTYHIRSDCPGRFDYNESDEESQTDPRRPSDHMFTGKMHRSLFSKTFFLNERGLPYSRDPKPCEKCVGK
jgi:hypothetical protein